MHSAIAKFVLPPSASGSGSTQYTRQRSFGEFVESCAEYVIVVQACLDNNRVLVTGPLHLRHSFSQTESYACLDRGPQHFH